MGASEKLEREKKKNEGGGGGGGAKEGAEGEPLRLSLIDRFWYTSSRYIL